VAEYTETELKLRFLEPGHWERVFASTIITEQADHLSFRQETLEARYYDTPSHSLQKARLAFRIRQEGGVWLATVKDGGLNSGGLHQRAEWTVPLSEPRATIEAFMDTPIGPALADAVGEEELTAMFATRFERQMINVHTPDGSIIELAADRGEISAGDGQSPILEIELELKSGCIGSLLQIGAALAEEFPLLPEWRSKYFRALQLAGLADNQEAPFPAKPVIEGGENAGFELAKLLIFSIQGVLVTQDRFLQLSDDPQSIHQMQIYLRRLRSLLSFSEPFMPEDIYISFQESLKHWVGMLGPLRQIDVAAEIWHEIVSSERVSFSASPVLGDKLAEKRIHLVAQIHKELDNGQATPQLLAMWSWFATNELLPRADAAEEAEMMVQPALEDFARERLAKWLDCMTKAGKDTEIQDDDMINMLRVRGKKVRYVLEALALIWPKKTAKMIERLKNLQDSLDYLHDKHADDRLFQELLRSQASRLLYRDMGIFAGWQAHKALSVQKKIKKQWKQLLRIERTWTQKINRATP
jgi:inorganic triphosphatase YgiF